jgi:hypothetical protein
MSPQREVFDNDRDRHLAAVARSLGWAQESAARGDYADALGWVRVVEAIGDPIPHKYETKRQAWRSALAESRVRLTLADDSDRFMASPSARGRS